MAVIAIFLSWVNLKIITFKKTQQKYYREHSSAFIDNTRAEELYYYFYYYFSHFPTQKKRQTNEMYQENNANDRWRCKSSNTKSMHANYKTNQQKKSAIKKIIFKTTKLEKNEPEIRFRIGTATNAIEIKAERNDVIFEQRR